MVVIQQMFAEGYVKSYEYAEYWLYIVNIVRRGIK